VAFGYSNDKETPQPVDLWIAIWRRPGYRLMDRSTMIDSAGVLTILTMPVAENQ
jgi:hypothetical protein